MEYLGKSISELRYSCIEKFSLDLNYNPIGNNTKNWEHLG